MSDVVKPRNFVPTEFDDFTVFQLLVLNKAFFILNLIWCTRTLLNHYKLPYTFFRQFFLSKIFYYLSFSVIFIKNYNHDIEPIIIVRQWS